MDGERGGHVRIFQWLPAECSLRAGLDDTVVLGITDTPGLAVNLCET